MQRRIESPVKHAKTINQFRTVSSCKKQQQHFKKFDLNKCQNSRIAYYLMLALLIVNLLQPLVAGSVNYSEKSQMITWNQLQSLEKHPC